MRGFLLAINGQEVTLQEMPGAVMIASMLAPSKESDEFFSKHPVTPAPTRVGDTEKMGKGLFAEAPLKEGDVIFVEPAAFTGASHPLMMKELNERFPEEAAAHAGGNLSPTCFYGGKGLAYFRTASYINNDCESPNAVAVPLNVRGEPTLLVRAVRTIMEGDEIFVSYLFGAVYGSLQQTFEKNGEQLKEFTEKWGERAVDVAAMGFVNAEIGCECRCSRCSALQDLEAYEKEEASRCVGVICEITASSTPSKDEGGSSSTDEAAG